MMPLKETRWLEMVYISVNNLKKKSLAMLDIEK